MLIKTFENESEVPRIRVDIKWIFWVRDDIYITQPMQDTSVHNDTGVFQKSVYDK